MDSHGNTDEVVVLIPSTQFPYSRSWGFSGKTQFKNHLCSPTLLFIQKAFIEHQQYAMFVV